MLPTGEEEGGGEEGAEGQADGGQGAGAAGGGLLPDVLCPTPACSRPFHAPCLAGWLQSLPDTRLTFNTLFGSCPFCRNPITVRMPRG